MCGLHNNKYGVLICYFQAVSDNPTIIPTKAETDAREVSEYMFFSGN